MTIPTTPPSGFRDFLPQACAARAAAVETISRVYRSFGFSQIATSAVEDLQVLMGKGGGENEKLIFKILKRGEKLQEALARSAVKEGPPAAEAPGEARDLSALADLGLRFDLTLPLARYYSRHGSQLPHPFKAFHIGPVWRAERAQKGRYREFFQCDADILGSESPLCEISVIEVLVAAVQALGLEQPTVVLSDRTLLLSLLDLAGVPPEKRGEACLLLDKLDKAPREQILSELEASLGAPTLKTLESAVLAPEPDLDRLRAVAPEAMARLEEILQGLRGLSARPERFRLCPSLVRGFDYYTGPIFELRHDKLSGSLGGGGRYDRLTAQFGGAGVAACGGSIGFERLMLLLEESGASPPAAAPRACVMVFSPELRGRSLKAAARLRAAGWDADLYPGEGKLKNQFKYADARKAALAVVIGPDEAAAGQVRVKDLATGEEKLETLESLAARP